MPLYDYFCPSNNKQIEVSHSINVDVKTWGDLCALAQCDPDNTPTDAPVRRVITAPRLMMPTSTTDYKNAGFSQYVKRDEGVYENVTAPERDSRFVNRDGQPIKP